MDSDLHRQQYSHHFQGLQRQFQRPPPQINPGGGLTRYRSAPSSYFSAFLDTATDFSPSQPRPLSPETESILARLMQSDVAAPTSPPHKLSNIPENSPPVVGVVKQETDQIQSFNNHNNSNLPSSSSQMVYQKPPLMSHSNSSMSGFMDFSPSQMRTNSNLVRHRSSPAGLFDDIIVENGYLVSRETGSEEFGSGSGNRTPGDFSSTAGRLNDQISFSSVKNQMVPATSDAGGRNTGINGLSDSRRFTNNDEDGFMSSFQAGSWDFSDQFPGPEMGGGDLDTSDHQVKEGKKRPAGLLSHHLSLPQASMEKLLQFQDSTPCNVRAKRGFATHPRSIAERVRRNKISERMRKLQDVVPNMDKQTNNSDMLDLAVDYIKDLQQQLKVLTDKQGRCTCTN